MTEPVTTYGTTVPGNRIYWASVLAGVFVTVSLLVLLGVLGVAIGLSGDASPTTGWTIGAIIWGIIAMVVAFGVGGYMAARAAALFNRGNATLHGMLVWAVAIPLLLFVFGSFSPALGQMGDGQPMRASIVTDRTAEPTGGVDVQRYASGSAWTVLIGLAIGLAAAAGAGAMAAKPGHHPHHTGYTGTGGPGGNIPVR